MLRLGKPEILKYGIGTHDVPEDVGFPLIPQSLQR